MCQWVGSRQFPQKNKEARLRTALFFVITALGFIVLGLFGVIVKAFNNDSKIFHVVGCLWAKMLLWAAGITVHVEGYRPADSCTFFICSNHASQMDIPVLYASLNLNFFFVAKKELFKIPFFGLIMKAAGHIPIDRENPREAVKALDEAKKRLEQGSSIVLFPEGTRSQDGRLQAFKSGGFRLAIRSKKDILPVALSHTQFTLPKGSIVPKPYTVSVRIGNPVEIQSCDTIESLSFKTMNIINSMLAPENQKASRTEKV